jgi:asparagine synthase (glutamine-hydrolysing)
MCGIVAMRSKTGPISEEALRRATEALRHRGPDGERSWIAASGSVGLGHTRLAIIDPEGGAQPIVSEDGRCRIVVNGEFYGFEAIRRELEERGHRFRTRSDSEIALHLYEDMGTRCVERLRGQFAFVIWDDDEKTLFAARDRFGQKPLFYHESNGILYLASEVKALYAAGVARGWDTRAVYHVLHACPDEERSLFADVRQVPPGHILVSTHGGTRLACYWDVPPPTGERRTRDSDRATNVERIHELVRESVVLRMRADVPVGCLLSGGVDSSTILGIAASCSEEPVAAFTVGFDHPDYDESMGAREAARYAGADHTLLAITDRAIADHFQDAVWHAETVQYNAHGTARYLLSRAVRQAGYKSVLAGEGADEVFFGYEFSRSAARASTRPTWLNWISLTWRLLRPSRRLNPGLGETSPWLARMASLLDLSPALLGRLAGGLGHLRSLCSPDLLREFEGYDIYHAYYRSCDKRAGISAWPPARQLTYLWLHSLFVNYHLAADRLDMAHGVEVRLPFLDHVLFEYAQQLPVSVLADPSRDKVLLREAVRPYVSPDVYSRAKKPFWAPPSGARHGNPLHELVQDTLRGTGVSAVPFLDRSAVVRLLDTLADLGGEEEAGVDSLLLLLTSISVLQERFRL